MTPRSNSVATLAIKFFLTIFFFFCFSGAAYGCGEDCSLDPNVCATSDCKVCNGFVCESCCITDVGLCDTNVCTVAGGECRDVGGQACPVSVPEVPEQTHFWLYLLVVPFVFLIPWMIVRRRKGLLGNHKT